MGQILNHQLKKGGIIMAFVFVLIVAQVIKLAFIIQDMAEKGKLRLNDSSTIMERLAGQDFSVLWLLLGAFILVWLYSVIDAYRVGRKIEKQEGRSLS
jgi:hypothetical protein